MLPTAELRVLVIDDHRVFTDVLRLGIDGEPGLRCVDVAHTLHEGLARAAATEFDVAVVDLELPDAVDLTIVPSLLALRPPARVLILTAFARPELARRALTEGASGFLSKETPLATLFRAIRSATVSSPVIDPPLPPIRLSDVKLTPREHDVLRQLGLGHEAHRIAENLGISLYTTRDHIKSVMNKLGAHSQLSAVVTAERLGLLKLGRNY